MDRRDNGLTAQNFKPLTDMEPDEADELLADLRDAGVAAYAAPMDGADPVPGMERLWVDAGATREARRVLRAFRERQWEAEQAESSAGGSADGGPSDGGRSDGGSADGGDAVGGKGGTGTAGIGGSRAAAPAPRAAESEDDVWARIVASFDTEVADEPRRWPAAEELGQASSPARLPAGDGRDGHRGVDVPAPGPRDWVPPADEELARRRREESPDELDEDPEEHFVPPPPPPLPRTDAATKAAWAALLGGPLFLLVSVLMGRHVGPWSTFFAFSAFTGGFVALVARLRQDRDDDDPDDGAIV